MKRDETYHDELFGDQGEPIESRNELVERCLPTITARIWETCRWPDTGWLIGDYRFAVIEFDPEGDDRASLYVQLWSEPEEAVLVEVSSGWWSPGSLKYMGQDQRAALEQLGYTIGGRAKNFRRELSVDSPDDAERLAGEMLGILFDVFGYRGEQPLKVKVRQDGRSETASVHTGLTPDDFMRIARQCGFRASLAPDGGAPVVALERRQFQSMATLGSRERSFGLFTSALLQASQDGRLIARTKLFFDGGVTTNWIAANLERWYANGRRLRRIAKRKPRGASSTTSGQKAARVH